MDNQEINNIFTDDKSNWYRETKDGTRIWQSNLVSVLAPIKQE